MQASMIGNRVMPLHGTYLRSTSSGRLAINAASSSTVMPSDSALANLEPAPGHATRQVVFLLTEPVAVPPRDLTNASAI